MVGLETGHGGRQAALEGSPVRKLFAVHADGIHAGLCSNDQPARVRAVGDDPQYLRAEPVLADGAVNGGKVAAAARQQNNQSLFCRCRHGQRNRTRVEAWSRAVTRPMTCTGSSSAAAISFAAPCGTTRTNPMPMFKVRRISASAILPAFCSQETNSGRGHARLAISSPRWSGTMRTMFSVRPPTVMWAMPRMSWLRSSFLTWGA